MSKSKRTLTSAQKNIIAARQRYKCANEPGSNLKLLENYVCPQWRDVDKFKGCFDEGGFEIDHITEFCINQNDHPDNLQALCKTCHSVKTKKFMIYRNMKNGVIKKDNAKNNVSDDDSDDITDDDVTDDDDVSDDDDRDDDSDDSDNDVSDDDSDDDDVADNNNANVNTYNTNNTYNNIYINNMYICKRCKKQFDRKSNYETHINRIFKCSPSNKITRLKMHSCPQCGKTFTRKYGMTKHLRICKKKLLPIKKRKRKKYDPLCDSDNSSDDESDDESDEDSDNDLDSNDSSNSNDSSFKQIKKIKSKNIKRKHKK